MSKNYLLAKLPNGKTEEVPYADFSDLLSFINANSLMVANSDRNKATVILIAKDTPKGRVKEIETALKAFNLKCEISDDLSWVSGGFGTKVDYSQPQAMKARGIRIDTNGEINEEAKAYFIKAVEIFRKAAEFYQAGRDKGFYEADGNFHIHKIDEFKVKKQKTV